MESVLFVVFAGGLAGLIHVLSGADHLAAVSVFAARERGAAWKAGLLWGVGHALGAGVVAGLALVLRDSLELGDVGWISSWGERLVGVTLLALGFWGLKRRSHSHRAPEAAGGIGRAAALGIGTLHGVSGASHFLGLLPALLLPHRASAAGYIAGFGAGTVAAMVGFAVVIGWAGRRLFKGGAGPVQGAYRGLLTGCSLASIAVGCFWIWSAF